MKQKEINTYLYECMKCGKLIFQKGHNKKSLCDECRQKRIEAKMKRRNERLKEKRHMLAMGWLVATTPPLPQTSGAGLSEHLHQPVRQKSIAIRARAIDQGMTTLAEIEIRREAAKVIE